MNYTTNELHRANFLLRSIGYTDINKINILLYHYEEKYSYWVTTKSIRAIKNRKGKTSRYIDDCSSTIKNDGCLRVMNWEVKIREKTNEIELKEYDENEYTSASDLAAFVFCNASYSILKSFVLKHSLNQFKKETGNNLHEKLMFIKKIYFGFYGNNNLYLNDKQKSIINKIKSCKLIFKGHGEENKIFVNHAQKYIGQPDYIFLDPNNDYFIVEEKYHFQKSNETTRPSENKSYKTTDFYLNNLIQLQSYIDFIEEYNCKYGVLINWYYHLNDGEIIIHDYTFKILKKNANNLLVEKIFGDLVDFKKNKIMKFNNDVYINKCANCSVNIYCSHKTDFFDTLKIPYDLAYLKLK